MSRTIRRQDFHPEVSPGQLLEFSYPADNRVNTWTKLTRRRFVIETIRDLETDPLSLQEIAKRPRIRRSRFLLMGHDVSIHESRKFYLGSARGIRTTDAELYRFAMVDPVTESIVRWMGAIYTDSKSDRQLTKEVWRQLQQSIAARPDFNLTVSLLPWRTQA